MQFKIFTIPISDNGAAVQEMNAFLRSNKILDVEKQLISNPNGAYWCFCVHYIEGITNTYGERREKTDYRQVLDEATFQKFSKLREIRKKVAVEEGISAFMVFTDEELAQLSKLEIISAKSMLNIKGIGEKKVERFAKYFITTPQLDETHRIPAG